jgi:hypothetical protein
LAIRHLLIVAFAGTIVGSATTPRFANASASTQTPPRCAPPVTPAARFVHGTVVISSDYLGEFVAGLRNLFGGRRGGERTEARAREACCV